MGCEDRSVGFDPGCGQVHLSLNHSLQNGGGHQLCNCIFDKTDWSGGDSLTLVLVVGRFQ